MNEPYLIQRCIIKNRPEKTGIDSLISLAYMGSAEFEWGAVPKSLQRIRENKNKYIRTQLTLSHNGYTKNIDVYCKKEDVKDVHDWLQLVAKNEHSRCIEFLGLDQHFSKSEISRDGLQFRKEDFWWDIENDFFFWFTNDTFTKQLLELL